jgi:FkbM family methyltransferase
MMKLVFDGAMIALNPSFPLSLLQAWNTQHQVILTGIADSDRHHYHQLACDPHSLSLWLDAHDGTDNLTIVVSHQGDMLDRLVDRPNHLLLFLDAEQRRVSHAGVEAGLLCITGLDQVGMLLSGRHAEHMLDLFRIDFEAHQTRQSAHLQRLKDEIMRAGGLCIYGAGTIGRQALAAARRIDLPVRAFVDRNTNLHGSRLSGIDVIGPDQLRGSLDMVVPALGRHLSQIRDLLNRAQVSLCYLSELYHLAQVPTEPERDYLRDLLQNRLHYLALFLNLADERSREVLAALVISRLTLNPAYLEAVCERGHPQWFDPAFLPSPHDAIFVDGGAFDGDTVAGYLDAQGDTHRAIYAFELDPLIASRGTQRLASYRDVHYINTGLSNRSGHVSIRSTGGTDGGIGVHGGNDFASDDNSRMVPIGRLDDLVPVAINYLKLDVEGEEAHVLEGATAHIRNDHPTIGMAVYHHAHDIWSLPEQLLSMRSDYQLYLRHYTDLAYETVIYAQPLNKP